MTEPGFDLESLTLSLCCQPLQCFSRGFVQDRVLGIGKEGSRNAKQVMDSKEFEGSIELKGLVGFRILEGVRWRDGKMQSESRMFFEIKILERVELLTMSKYRI